MLGISVKVEPRFEQVQKAADDATFRNIRHAAFSISKAAKQSIATSPEASQPGSPPTTRGKGGHNLRGAIFVDANKESAIIGPRASFVGIAGEVHEFGKDREGESFAERPFMGPALEKSLPRFADDWRGSIGQ